METTRDTDPQLPKPQEGDHAVRYMPVYLYRKLRVIANGEAKLASCKRQVASLHQAVGPTALPRAYQHAHGQLEPVRIGVATPALQDIRQVCLCLLTAWLGSVMVGDVAGRGTTGQEGSQDRILTDLRRRRWIAWQGIGRKMHTGMWRGLIWATLLSCKRQLHDGCPVVTYGMEKQKLRVPVSFPVPIH